jgi:hypothetical protein
MKVNNIPCHATGHINVTLVLQSCTDPLFISANEEEEDISINQEEFPGDNFFDVESDSDEVSYVCVSLLIDIQCDSKRWTQFCTSVFPELYMVCE